MLISGAAHIATSTVVPFTAVPFNPWLASYRFGMERHFCFGFQQCHVFAGSLTIPWPSIVHKNMNWFKTVLLKERELCVQTQSIAAHFESLQKAFRAGGKPCRSEFRIGFRTLTAMWSGWRTMCALSPAGVGHCIDLHLLFPDLLWLQRGHEQVLVAGPRTEGCLIWWCFVKHLRFGTCYDLPWFYHVFMASYWLFIMMSRVLPVPRPCFSMFHTDAGHVPSCQGRVFALAAALPMCQIPTAGAALEARGKPNDILLLLKKEKTVCFSLSGEIIWRTWFDFPTTNLVIWSNGLFRFC